MRCVFTLVINLGLAQLALKTHAFSACVNGVSQLSLRLTHYRLKTGYVGLSYLVKTHSLPVKNRLCGSFSYLGDI